MAIFRETSAVGAEKCSHSVNIIAICKVGTLTEVGSGGGGGWCLPRDPQPHLKGKERQEMLEQTW